MAIADRILGGDITKLEEAVELYGAMAFTEYNNSELLRERIAELELAMEDAGWQRIVAEGDREFSRAGLKTITKACRLYWIKNPLVKRAVYTQTAYVFGQGMSIEPMSKELDVTVKGFLNDPKNAAELTSHQARMIKETELQVDGNLFFVFFVNKSTGSTRLRTIPFDEIFDIIHNPEDAKEPWYYIRVWREGDKERIAAYPDFRYNPKKGPARRVKVGDQTVEVLAEQIYHVKVNCLSDMKFGVSEVYAAVDWARAYKDFLEDWAAIVRALSRFAWRATSKAGQRGIDAIKEKLDSAVSLTDPSGQLPPNAGSTLITTDAVQLEAINKTGTTTSVQDGRRLLLMVSAATGIFEHYFGDPSTGNLATAASMERPMELMFVDRQELWKTIFNDIIHYVIDQAGIAPNGKLPAKVEWNDYDERTVTITLPGKDSEFVDTTMNITFPSILEKDIVSKVSAIVAATTLSGQALAGTFDLPTATRMLLVALGSDDVDGTMERLFPEGEIPQQLAAQKLPGGPQAANATERLIVEAIEELKDAASQLAGEGEEAD